MNTATNTYVCKYTKKRGKFRTMIINQYYLGLMWSIGSLAKDKSIYVLQSFEPDKIYYMDQLRNITLADVNTRTRKYRGEDREIKILRFTDGVYAERLRELGYDNPDVEYPDVKNIEFICAVLECRIKVANTNSKTVQFNASVSNVEQWNRLVSTYLTASKPPVVLFKDKDDYRICYTREEMYACAKIMVLQECSNKDFWNGIIELCEK